MTPGFPLAISGVAALVALLAAPRTPRLWLGAVLAASFAALAAGALVFAAGTEWEWRSSLTLGGEGVHLRLDGVGALFLSLLSVVGAAGAAYSMEYWTAADHPASASANRGWWSGLLLSLGLVLLVSNGLHFLIGWEAFTVCAYFLITLDARRRAVRAAGWLYLAASHAGALALFAFFAALAGRTGSWELGPMRDRPELAPLFWLALAGFGIKAGLFPLHIWLPSAHANAPSHVSAILSGVAIKMGIYGIVRFSGWLPVPDAAGWLLTVLGAASAVLGVAFALGQHDLKRLLAYHSVENIGIILLGVGFALLALNRGRPEWGALALAGGLLHVWNHGLFKALLFLSAGSVLHATGTREMSQLGGLWRSMPWTASLFTLAAMAISGLPPLNGFISEWLIYLGLLEAAGNPGETAYAAIPVLLFLAVTGALALACFVKACGVVFLGAPRSETARVARESGPWMCGSMLLLGLGCVAIGLAPLLFWPAIHSAVTAWDGGWMEVPAPESLASIQLLHGALALSATVAAAWLWRRIRRARWSPGLTWDCGYACPSPRMQYTAGSFAGIITDWFGWILRPDRHVHLPEEAFPDRAVREEHTPETVLERCIEPVGRRVLQLSGWVRQFQHGRVQAYLFYLLVGMAALAALTAAWNP